MNWSYSNPRDYPKVTALNTPQTILSKVLVLENDPDCLDRLKRFCDAEGLIGVRVTPGHLLKVLNSTLDLGAILLAEPYAGSALETLVLARYIRQSRPELPIFLRQEESGGTDAVDGLTALASACYTRTDMTPLRQGLNRYLFSLLYPDSLVNGIMELSLNALAHQFTDLTVACNAPCLVRDRIIFGEVFTLIPLESSWFKGYMLLQTEETGLLQLVETHTDFRRVNNLLSEITNLIWGAFKNRYIPADDPGTRSPVQVPIVINHAHHYVSFGSDHPHLCFEYTLANPTGEVILNFQQWFVFNLNWSPERFHEVADCMADLVESGELELF
ncbi:MAG: hypothetical protein RLZZ226_410 [Pseudomonadota bacterium]